MVPFAAPVLRQLAGSVNLTGMQLLTKHLGRGAGEAVDEDALVGFVPAGTHASPHFL